MTISFEPGTRIRLVRTDDQYTALKPGDEGTVHRTNLDAQSVDVDWDSGSKLSLLLDADDFEVIS